MYFTDLAFLVFVIVWMVSLPYRRKQQRWEVAAAEREAMFSMLKKMRDESFMTRRMWEEWLPVFDYLDKYYAANNPVGSKAASLADGVRKEIDPISLQGA